MVGSNDSSTTAVSGTGISTAGVLTRAIAVRLPLVCRRKWVSYSIVRMAVAALRADAACTTFSSGGKTSASGIGQVPT